VLRDPLPRPVEGPTQRDGSPPIRCYSGRHGDKLFVDTWFDASEMAVAAIGPSVVKRCRRQQPARDLRSSRKGSAQLLAHGARTGRAIVNTRLDTGVAVIRSIRCPRSALAAALYLAMAVAARRNPRAAKIWELTRLPDRPSTRRGLGGALCWPRSFVADDWRQTPEPVPVGVDAFLWTAFADCAATVMKCLVQL
jgi:hypothetical protein